MAKLPGGRVRLNLIIKHIRLCAKNHTTSTASIASTRATANTKEELIRQYNQTKNAIYRRSTNLQDTSEDVFVNNEVSLRHINSFGFDYDYTFASYSDEVHRLIYNISKRNLIQTMNYPKNLLAYKFEVFPIIRGLHFDTGNGFLMKLDSRSRIQMGTVYRGYEKISDAEVIQEYGDPLIDLDLISTASRRSRIFHLTDMFSIALLSLVTNVIQHFQTNNIPFSPSYIFQDVENAVQQAHRSGKISATILSDLDRYSPKQEELEVYLNRLVSNGKKLFIITNSSFNFMSKGMMHLFGPDWQDLFEVVVVEARKPHFFNAAQPLQHPTTPHNPQQLPFRNINCTNGTYLWNGVKRFEKHGVYGQGNIALFNEFTGFERSTVIYWGDHVYNNLVGPALRIGWRTGALVPELRDEIEIFSSKDYVRNMEWLMELEKLITLLQGSCFDAENMLVQWRKERKALRRNLKDVFNPCFGSIFRANENPSSFSKRVTHYADLYTSSVVNMLNYSDDFHFLPGRNLLPHERF